MSSSEAIRVIVRVRPLDDDDASAVQVSSDCGTDSIRVDCAKDRAFSSAFDAVLGTGATQADVFSKVDTVVSSVAAGFNACILAYGQTGAGKTHTMLGSSTEEGILPRAMRLLFEKLEANRGEGTYEVHASLLQIYGEKLDDLLVSSSEEPLRIREIHRKKKSELYVAGLSTYRVEEPTEATLLFERGLRSRTVRATQVNEASSRSHAVLQLSVESRGTLGLRRAKLYLVDLAGSEKASALNVNATRVVADGGRTQIFAEHVSINQSLSTLGNVIAALSEGPKRRPHVPYRESTLTRLLQDALGGNTRTAVIACVSASARNAEETVSTLKFADRARRVMARVKPNREVIGGGESEAALLRALRKAHSEIARLRVALEEALSSDQQPAVVDDDDDDVAMEPGAASRVKAENSRLRTENASLRKLLALQPTQEDDPRLRSRSRRKMEHSPRRPSIQRPHSSSSSSLMAAAAAATPKKMKKKIKKLTTDSSLSQLLYDAEEQGDAYDSDDFFRELRGALRDVDELAAPDFDVSDDDEDEDDDLRAQCAAGSPRFVAELLSTQQLETGLALGNEASNVQRLRRERLELEAQLKALSEPSNAPDEDSEGGEDASTSGMVWTRAHPNADERADRETDARASRFFQRPLKKAPSRAPPPMPTTKSPRAVVEEQQPASQKKNPNLEIKISAPFSPMKDKAAKKSKTPSPAHVKLFGDGRDVGARVEVYSFRFNRHYAGEVVNYEARRGMHAVQYDGGERTWHDLKAHEKNVRVLRPGQGQHLASGPSSSPVPPTPLSLSGFIKAASSRRLQSPLLPNNNNSAMDALSPYLRANKPPSRS